MKRIVILFILLACSTAFSAFDDSILKASTDVTFEVLLRGDDDGMGETGETSATVTCYYMRQGAAAAVEVTMATGILGTHADGGWLAVDATNMPGLYQFHSPDLAFATGANAVTFMFTATGVIDKTVKFALVNYDPRSATNLGLSVLTTIAGDVVNIDGIVPESAGTVAAAHAITDALVDDVETTLALALAEVAGLNGEAMRGTNGAALASVVGALTDAAAAGDPTTADTLVQYVKQLVNVLVGTTGVTTFPAAAAPANNVSLAEAIRATYNLAAAESGSGAITFTYTLTDSDSGDPIADASVWVTSDIAGTTVIASGQTNQNGVVVFYLDAGTVYVWRQKTGFDFTNPDTEVVE